MLKKILVVVADESEASFYIVRGPKEMNQLHFLPHPEGRLHDSELTTKEHDVTTFPYEDRDSTKQHGKEQFVNEVIASIKKILIQEVMNDVFIFAPSKMIGLIHRDKLDKHVNLTEINKDLVKLDQQKLHDAINAHIFN